jgi:hypothetical protein
MMWFILVLLLLAAIFGVLGTVLKVTAVIILSIILAVLILGWLAWWGLKRQVRLQTKRYVDGTRADGPPPVAGEPGASGQVYDAEGHIVRPELPE